MVLTHIQPQHLSGFVINRKESVVWVQEAYRGAESRMVQEAMRRHVLRVLRIWRSWFLFSDDYLNGLQVSPKICA